MLTWKKTIATVSLNKYMTEELNRLEQYSRENRLQQNRFNYEEWEADVHSLPKERRDKRRSTQEDIDLDMEAAELAWPNFKMLFTRFKDHPALGPGAVTDSAVTPPSKP